MKPISKTVDLRFILDQNSFFDKSFFSLYQSLKSNYEIEVVAEISFFLMFEKTFH